MSRIHLGVTLAAVAVAVAVAGVSLALSSGCSDPPPPGPPPGKAPDPDEMKKLREEAQKAADAQRAVLDKDARGLLASCDSRVYRPLRDSALERASGRIDVKSGGREASYRFSFDVANPSDKPVTFETVSEPAAWDPAVAADVRRWGVLACVSAYEIVAYYRPPTQLTLKYADDGKNKLVIAPSFRTPLNVSYSFDPQQVIAARGEWTDEEHKVVTNYEWKPLSGRYLLERAKVYEGPDTRFEYDICGDLVLLRTVHVAERDPGVDAQITFDKIERRAK